MLKIITKTKIEKIIKELDINKLNEFVKKSYQSYDIYIPAEKIKFVDKSKLIDTTYDTSLFGIIIHGKDYVEKILSYFNKLFGNDNPYATINSWMYEEYYTILYNLDNFGKIFYYNKEAMRSDVLKPIIESMVVEGITHHYTNELNKLENRPHFNILLYESNNMYVDLPRIIARKSLEGLIAKKQAISYLDEFYDSYSKKVYIKILKEEFELSQEMKKCIKLHINLPLRNFLNFIDIIGSDEEKLRFIFKTHHFIDDIADNISYSIILNSQELDYYKPSNYKQCFERIMNILSKKLRGVVLRPDNTVSFFYIN